MNDSEAVDAVKSHHEQLAAAMAARVEAMLTAASAGAPSAAAAARADLVGWVNDELLPHARAEERALYPAAHALPEGRLLIDAMIREHRQIAGLVAGLDAGAGSAAGAAADARALQVLFGSHLEKENEQILPLLAGTPGVSVAQLLAGMHELLG